MKSSMFSNAISLRCSLHNPQDYIWSMSITFYVSLLAYLILVRPCVEALRCEIGEAWKDPSNPLLDRTCTEGVASSCLAGYECIARSNGLSVCCPSKTSVCSEQREVGSSCGRAVPLQRYYFDSTQSACLPFIYNGCFGNNNNFYTIEECDRACLEGPCPRGAPARSAFGGQQGIQQCAVGQIGQFGASACPANYECLPRTGYGQYGQQGTGVCCPSADYVCRLPVQAGSPCAFSSQPMARYYFEPVTRSCQTFQFSGCNGNDNNFATLLECQQYCSNQQSISGQPCPAGSSPAPGVTQATPCQQFTPCPFGYSCQYSPSHGQTYCCSTGSPVPAAGQLCADGSQPVLGNQQCVPSDPNACPFGSTCQPNQQGQWHCCSTSISPSIPLANVCPTGSTVQPGATRACSEIAPCSSGYVCEYSAQTGSRYCCTSRDAYGQFCPIGTNPAPGYTQPCTFGTFCPNGYTCQPSPRTGQSYCCSSQLQQDTSQFCPAGSTPAPGVSTATACSPYGTNICTPGYSCQQSPFSRLWYCCSSPTAAASQFCPAGSTPAPGVSTATTCSPYGTNICTPGYSCQQSPFSRLWYCCSSPTSPASQFCPAEWTPAPESDINRPCNAYSPCRTGYYCQRSPFLGQSYCCKPAGSPADGPSSYSLCPVGTSPAPGVTSATPCVAGRPCVTGYTCQTSPSNGFSYCCSQPISDTSRCPQGGTPLIDPSTSRPATCSAERPCRYSQYTCQFAPGDTVGLCCHSTLPIGGQECPNGLIAYRPAGQIMYCQFGNQPQQAMCQPYAQCLASPTLGTYVCCARAFRQRMITSGPAIPTNCKTDEDCSQIKGAQCTGATCQCTDGSVPPRDGNCPSTVTDDTLDRVSNDPN